MKPTCAWPPNSPEPPACKLGRFVPFACSASPSLPRFGHTDTSPPSATDANSSSATNRSLNPAPGTGSGGGTEIVPVMSQAVLEEVEVPLPLKAATR